MSEKRIEYNLDAFIEAELSPDRVLCPRCGARFRVPGSYADKRFGVCPTCYLQGVAEAKREQARAIEAQREFNAARRQLQRAARRNDG